MGILQKLHFPNLEESSPQTGKQKSFLYIIIIGNIHKSEEQIHFPQFYGIKMETKQTWICYFFCNLSHAE